MLKESTETKTRMRWEIFGSSQEQKEANLPKIVRACTACFVFMPEHLGNKNQKWWEENVGGNSLSEKKEDYYCFFYHLANTTIFISSDSAPVFFLLCALENFFGNDCSPSLRCFSLLPPQHLLLSKTDARNESIAQKYLKCKLNPALQPTKWHAHKWFSSTLSEPILSIQPALNV